MSNGENSKASPFQSSKLWIWAVALLILTILGVGLINLNETRPEAGSPAPDFDVSFFDGYEWNDAELINLSEMQGSVVVLNFWASWCVECRYEADLLQDYSEKYAAQDVIFLGVAWTDTEPKSLAYLEEFGITYPNGPDLGLEIGGKYEITGIPETFFIDKNGEIAQVIVGPVSEEILDGVISTLVAE